MGRRKTGIKKKIAARKQKAAQHARAYLIRQELERILNNISIEEKLHDLINILESYRWN